MARLLLDGWIGLWTFMTYLCYVAGQAPCLTASEKKGQCVSIFDCSVMLDLVSSATPTMPVIQNFSFCGLDKSTQTVQVCCPSNECLTPDGVRATCVELDLCPNLMNMLTTKPTIATIKHLHNQICRESENSVCCVLETLKPSAKSNTGDNDQDDTVLETCKLGTLPLDPKSKCCGIHTNIDPRIVGGEKAEIDDYPWLVLLEYRIEGKIVIGCGGSLISGKFVLTAAHCVGRKPISVRLGEFNTTNPGKDCMLVAGAGEDCTDDPLIVEIETIIPHPFTDFNKENDIALIKLQRIVPYTDFIRPICLPTNDFSISRREENLYTAGWGVTEMNVYSDIKLKVNVPYVPHEICRRAWPNLGDDKMCAGGELGKDSCTGDSGGPLMIDIGGKHEVVGIVSYGATPCGQKDVPGVYTKVYKHMPWIVYAIQ